jgi:ElaB/YqjD/DUF883 family membrane-anchored ribosome-binding protein
MTEKFDRKNLENRMNELGKQVADLLRRLETAVDKEADALRPKLKAALDELNELRRTGADAWEADVKPSLKKAWNELHTSLNQAAARFKNRPKS